MLNPLFNMYIIVVTVTSTKVWTVRAQGSDPPSDVPSATSITLSDAPSRNLRMVPTMSSDMPSDSSSTQPSDMPSDLPSVSSGSMSPSNILPNMIDVDSIRCSPVQFNDTDVQVCYVATAEAISTIGFSDENFTTTVAQQRYSYQFDVVDDDKEHSGITIEVQRSGEVIEDVNGSVDLTECDFVQVTGQLCASCTYCGNETYTVDCTNINHGRYLECESVFPVLFPLTIDAVPDSPATDPLTYIHHD